MSEKKKSKKPAGQPANEPETAAQPPEAEAAPAPEAEAPGALPAEVEALREQAAAQEEKYLRLCAEYDNYRKRTAREKESAWSSAKGETVKALLPVYDNLERALRQETDDEAFKKGVELTMQQLKKVLADLGVEEIPALGETFDANVHSAVMHVEDPDLGENTVKEVFQAGFKLGQSVLRYAMVVVAN